MLLLQRIPKLLRWIFSVIVIVLVTMSLSRLIIFYKFTPPGKGFSGSAFIMGFRYDARVASIIGLFMLLLCTIPQINPFKNLKAKHFWNILLSSIFITLVFVLTIDYYHFDYLHQRLNATVLNYLQDSGISLAMIWQSYPLLKISLAFLLILILVRFAFGALLANYQQHDSFYKRKGIFLYFISFLIFGIFTFGKIGQFPLRWSDAFTLSDNFKANLALNPFQSFISTLNFRNTSYNIKKVRAAYPLMAKYLGVNTPDSNTLNFERINSVTTTLNYNPNIILIICESFSAYKSSMYNNPLNTTPYFNNLTKNGVFFDRCFTPAYGTARGVWATITGIPDVESPKTASRNPNAVDQNTIINSFKNYTNFYFLGGSASWANIRGILTNNINNLNLYEQDDYSAKKIDIWGISDKNLFLESNKILKKQTNPFFAIIQTADNHRPYTIPAEDKATFKPIFYPSDSLKQFGFESNEEMNAFRYTDFCYQQFMETAQKETYFNNTIFVFVGDHGIRYNGTLNNFPKSWTEQGLTCEHVPLLFYAPGLIIPQRISNVCSQIDILPTIASLAKISYTNNTLGRNLFDTVTTIKLNNEKYAFIIDHDVKTIGLVSNKYYYLKNYKTGKEDFVSMTSNTPILINAETDQTKKQLQQLTDAYYETAKYLLLNNKKNFLK